MAKLAFAYKYAYTVALDDAVKAIMSIPYTEIDNYPLVLLKEAIDAVNSLREGEDNETILREMEVQ